MVENRFKPLTGTILLAEDSIVNQEVMAITLGAFGCKVDTVEDGKVAVEFWRNNSYDLVLMDCLMPIMDGYEAARSIRQQEADGSRIPIIAITARTGEADRKKAFDAGMDEHFVKPFKIEELHALLSRWLTF